MPGHCLNRYLYCLLMSWLVTGCAGDTPPLEPDHNVDDTNSGSISLHAVMSEQLALENARLHVLLFDLHRTETVLARERGALVARIAEAARRLQRGAAVITASSASLALVPDEVDRLNALALTLASRAGTLADQAEAGTLGPEQLEAGLAAIDATCNSCHALYRDPGNQRR